MPSLIEVDGNITVTGNDNALNTIDMSALTTVNGDISVDGNAQLQTIDMSALTTVNGDISVDGNAQLNTIDMSALTTVNGDISVARNPRLAIAADDRFEMGALASARSVTFSNNTGAAADKTELFCDNCNATVSGLTIQGNTALTQTKACEFRSRVTLPVGTFANVNSNGDGTPNTCQ